MKTTALIALFAPFAGFLCVGLFFRYMTALAAQVITCTFIGAAAAAGFLVVKDACFFGQELSFPLFSFISVGGHDMVWGLHLDALSGLMIGVVTTVSLMVHLYSVGYMHGDPSTPRFMAYISLFTFCMLVLVTAPNLVQLFVGWEGVGLASYLLIGYYYDRESASQASMKAFLVNRVGDVGFVLAMCLVFFVFQSLDFATIFEQVPRFLTHQTYLPVWGTCHTLSLICALFFVGAMGKSAQLGLHVWLPDAMEGPTPVSALIHAATMVTAGIFLLVRLSPLLEYAPIVQNVILIIGALTAFFAGTVAMTQMDIKRVIAYSTCSQLGYMFMAVGVSAYNAAMFHLTTHAFFKALLFLGAGSTIHALSGGQDLREMGGLYRLIPFTYATMWLGSLALAGLPFFAGYYSKDAILEYLWLTGSTPSLIAFGFGLVVVFLTAFYSWRLLILAFHGESRANPVVLGHVHESPPIMLGPLCLLSLGALFSGFFLYTFFLGPDPMWGKAIFLLPQHQKLFETHHHLPLFIQYLPLGLALSGIGLAFYFYQSATPTWPQFFVEKYKTLYLFFFRKWYFDELYQALITTPLWKSAYFLWQKGDMKGIDHFGPNGAVVIVGWLSKRVSLFQTGYLYHYAFAMIVGLAIGLFMIMRYIYF